MKKVLIIGLLLMTSACYADEGRVRNEVYDADAVYPLYTAIGRATLIQFENDESLVSTPGSLLGVGDADAWNIGVRGNNIVLKPTKKMPQTNILVVTNKRTYAFELVPNAKGKSTTYILRFLYPDSDSAKSLAIAHAAAKRAKITEVAKSERVKINTEYTWRGVNQLLRPTGAYDDGVFTRLVYNNSGELPAFFKVLPDGSEALLNSSISASDKSTVILHEVSRTVRVRLGSEVGEIVNRAYTLPDVNNRGASEHGVVRVDRESGNE